MRRVGHRFGKHAWSLRWAFVMLIAGLAFVPATVVTSPATPAQAASGFVHELGRQTGSTASVMITTTAAAARGDSIIVAVGLDTLSSLPSTVSCSDPVNGAYQTDVPNTDYTAICSVHNIQPLPSGSHITITTSVGSVEQTIAEEYSGLALHPFDRSAVTTGSNSSTSFVLGPVTTTSQANEVLIATFLHASGTPGATLAILTNGTTNQCAENGSTPGPTYIISPTFLNGVLYFDLAHCTVSTTSAYEAAGAFAFTSNWWASMATYRLAVAPTITMTATVLSDPAPTSPVAIDPGLTITADRANLSGGTVSISSGFTASQDSLGFTNQSGITGNYNPSTGVLTLTGTTTPASYQAALRSVTYTSSTSTPSPSAKTISFQVSDDVPQASNLATRQIAAGPPTPTPTATPVPTATPAPSPSVRLSESRDAPNQLLVTVTARSGETLDRLAWTLPPNAAAESLSGVALPTGITLPAGSTSASFHLRRVSGQSVTLPILATGSFGTWQTFVGGGSNAWQ